MGKGWGLQEREEGGWQVAPLQKQRGGGGFSAMLKGGTRSVWVVLTRVLEVLTILEGEPQKVSTL